MNSSNQHLTSKEPQKQILTRINFLGKEKKRTYIMDHSIYWISIGLEIRLHEHIHKHKGI
jgi:hypothetical protein